MNVQNDHWDLPSNFTEYIPLSINKENLDLIVKVLKKSGYFHSKGIVLVLDTKQSSDYPENSVFHNKLGFYINVKKEIEHGGICWSEDNKTVSDLMYSQGYEHLIWLSPKAYSMSKEDCVWNLSHEIRHMEQSNICHSLLIAGCQLTEVLPHIKPDKPSFNIPTELDANREAWCISRKVFSDEPVADKYVENNCLEGERIEEFKVLHSKFNNDPSTFNIFEEMVLFLKEHLELMEKEKIELLNLEDKYKELRKCLSVLSALILSETAPNQPINADGKNDCGLTV